MTDSLIIIVSC